MMNSDSRHVGNLKMGLIYCGLNGTQSDVLLICRLGFSALRNPHRVTYLKNINYSAVEPSRLAQQYHLASIP